MAPSRANLTTEVTAEIILAFNCSVAVVYGFD
jgi:hypothetical protein